MDWLFRYSRISAYQEWPMTYGSPHIFKTIISLRIWQWIFLEKILSWTFPHPSSLSMTYLLDDPFLKHSLEILFWNYCRWKILAVIPFLSSARFLHVYSCTWISLKMSIFSGIRSEIYSRIARKSYMYSFKKCWRISSRI